MPAARHVASASGSYSSQDGSSGTPPAHSGPTDAPDGKHSRFKPQPGLAEVPCWRSARRRRSRRACAALARRRWTCKRAERGSAFTPHSALRQECARSLSRSERGHRTEKLQAHGGPVSQPGEARPRGFADYRHIAGRTLHYDPQLRHEIVVAGQHGKQLLLQLSNSISARGGPPSELRCNRETRAPALARRIRPVQRDEGEQEGLGGNRGSA